MKFFILAIPLLICSMSSCDRNCVKSNLNKFENSRDKFYLVAEFLTSKRQIIEETKCDKLYKSINQLNDEGCYIGIQDSMEIILNMNLFQDFSYSDPDCLELEMNREVNSLIDKEIRCILVYAHSSTLPDEYLGNSEVIKIDGNWWYIEQTCALY